MSIANEWGDWAPTGSTLTYPQAKAFFDALLASDGIATINIGCVQRSPSNQAVVRTVSLDTVFGRRQAGDVLAEPGNPWHDAPLELMAQFNLMEADADTNHGAKTYNADEFPGLGQMNVALFMAGWTASEPSGSAARIALLRATWPDIDPIQYYNDLAQKQANAKSAMQEVAI